MAQIRLDRDEVRKKRLPGVCMRCGQPAALYKDKKFAWYPPWIGVMVLVAVPVYIILALVMTKRMTVSAPLCEAHKNHWLVRTLVSLVGLALVLLLCFGALILIGALSDARNDDALNALKGIACGGSVVALVAWLITLVVMQATAIRPNEITDDTITLTGLSEGFVNAVEDVRDQEEEDYRARRRARRTPSDNVHDPKAPRRRPAPPPDAYQAEDE
jgi:hypothetical protein